MATTLLAKARHDAGLSQAELAACAGTSRTTLSAYEHGRKSPTMATAERVLNCAGFTLTAEPTIGFREVTPGRGHPMVVPNRLWRLPIQDAFATVSLPLTIHWSPPTPVFNLANRHDRARCYEIVLREGSADDLRRYIDGVLLIDLWDDLVLPRDLRAAWQPTLESALP